MHVPVSDNNHDEGVVTLEQVRKHDALPLIFRKIDAHRRFASYKSCISAVAANLLLLLVSPER